MANTFALDWSDDPSTIPPEISETSSVIGETTIFDFTNSDDPPAVETGKTLAFWLAPGADQAPLLALADARFTLRSGTTFRLTLTAAETLLIPGRYYCEVREVTVGAEKVLRAWWAQFRSSPFFMVAVNPPAVPLTLELGGTGADLSAAVGLLYKPLAGSTALTTLTIGAGLSVVGGALTASGGGGGAVDSVNGQTGVVVLGAADVGADAAGTAAAAIAAHVAAANPHPVYLTQAEGDALYAPIGGGGMAIGGTVTGGTAGRLLIVGAGPVLAEHVPATDTVAVGRLAANFGSGARNERLGDLAGNNAATGTDNIALGYRALSSLTSGLSNVAVGSDAGQMLTSGSNNFALGRLALDANTTGGSNVAIGSGSLQFGGAISGNIGIGNSALQNATADYNAVVGTFAGMSITSGTYNVAFGTNAGRFVLATGVNNTLLGANTDTAGAGTNYALALGYGAVAGSNECVFGPNLSLLKTVGVFEFTQVASGGTPASNSARLYAKDVAGTAELFTMDEAGNETQQTAHAMDGPAALYEVSPELPYLVKEVQHYLGYVRYLNVSRCVYLLEELLKAVRNDRTLPQIATTLKNKPAAALDIYRVETFAAHNARTGSDLVALSWSGEQQKLQDAYDAARAAELLAHEAWQTAVDTYPGLLAAWEAADPATRGAAPAEPGPEPTVRPAEDIRKPVPQWLSSRGVT